MRSWIFLMLAALLFPPTLVADEVILDYEATADTVVGTPFGMTVPLKTKVIGVIAYQTDGAIDSDPTEARGTYQLTAGGAFIAKFLCHTVTGSTTPRIRVEEFDTSDTIRVDDGNGEMGTMAYDGNPEDDIDLSFSITASGGAALGDDSLPAVFPMTIPASGPPPFPVFVTFVLSDDGGSMHLQFQKFVQRKPNTLKIVDVAFKEGAPSICFHSAPEKTYTVEFSTDLKIWQPIATDLPAQSYVTDFADTGIVGRLGSLPDKAFYRVRENP